MWNPKCGHGNTHILKKWSLDVAFKGKVSRVPMHVNNTEEKSYQNKSFWYSFILDANVNAAKQYFLKFYVVFL